MESAVTVLPEPELAHQRHGLGLADVEGDVLDGVDDVASAAAEIDGQVFDADKRRFRRGWLGAWFRVGHRSSLSALRFGSRIGAHAVLDLDGGMIQAKARMQPLLDGFHHAVPFETFIDAGM